MKAWQSIVATTFLENCFVNVDTEYDDDEFKSFEDLKEKCQHLGYWSCCRKHTAVSFFLR